MKINLGCGTNKLHGWHNHDDDVDITKRLPWDDATVTHVLAEHVVEHVTYFEAIDFFVECHRVLVPGGVCRIAVPSVERIWQEATPEYCNFTEKWSMRFDDTFNGRRRGALRNVLVRHGHRAPWTEGLLLATLFFAGFDEVVARDPGRSDHDALRGVEGHGRVIGDEFNAIETVVAEATKNHTPKGD